MPGEPKAAPAPAPAPAAAKEAAAGGAAKAPGDDKEECAWCKFMKAGGCGGPFEAWQSCVDAVMGDDLDASARKAAIDKCSNVTRPLFECMMKHKDYYGPQLAAMGGGGDEGSSSGSGGGSGGAAAGRGGAAS